MNRFAGGAANLGEFVGKSSIDYINAGRDRHRCKKSETMLKLLAMQLQRTRYVRVQGLASRASVNLLVQVRYVSYCEA